MIMGLQYIHILQYGKIEDVKNLRDFADSTIMNPDDVDVRWDIRSVADAIEVRELHLTTR